MTKTLSITALLIVLTAMILLALFAYWEPKERVMIVDGPMSYSEQLEALQPNTLLIQIDTKRKLN